MRIVRGSITWAALALAASMGIANAATYNVFGTFSDAASLTGTIAVDNGELLSVNLNGGNALPGDKAVNFFGTPLCLQMSCAPSQSSYSYLLPLQAVSEKYTPSTQTYNFSFNGGGATASLDLIFSLQPLNGLVLGGKIFDFACSPNCPFNPFSVNITGGTLSATPLPATFPLFIAGLAVLGLFSAIGTVVHPKAGQKAGQLNRS